MADEDSGELPPTRKVASDEDGGELRPTPDPELVRAYSPHLVSLSGHTASLFGYVKLPLRLWGGQEEKITLEDGGSVVLHWWTSHRLPTRAMRPIVLLVHGINNSSSTPYIQYTCEQLEATGFDAVVLNMRGHGHGNHISSNRLYTGRADADLRAVCERIRVTRNPPALYAVGFSMGANQVLAFLGGGGGGAFIDAAVAVSCPFDLAQLAEYFRTGTPRLYGALIAQPLKRLLWEGRHHLRLTRQQFVRGMAALSIEEFDTAIQVPLLGLSSAEEYWRTNSCIHHLDHITTPTLVIHAIDDPLIPPYVFPQSRLRANPHVEVVVTERGGHIGWVAGKTPLRQNWTDKLIARWLRRFDQSRTADGDGSVNMPSGVVVGAARRQNSGGDGGGSDGGGDGGGGCGLSACRPAAANEPPHGAGTSLDGLFVYQSKL